MPRIAKPTPADVGRRLGVTDPTDEQYDVLGDAIDDIQGQVEGFLGRTLVPETVTLTGARPAYGGDLTEASTWTVATGPLNEPRIQVVSATPDTDGTYTLTVLAGLDGAAEPAITSFIVRSAAAYVRGRPEFKMGQRAVTSVSGDGQSVSYQQASVAEGAAGADPNIKELARFKRRAVFRRPASPRPPWPYAGR